MLRIADAGGAWRKDMVARLLMDRTMAQLHGEGCRAFDFALGEQAYKRRIGARPVPPATPSRPRISIFSSGPVIASKPVAKTMMSSACFRERVLMPAEVMRSIGSARRSTSVTSRIGTRI